MSIIRRIAREVLGDESLARALWKRLDIIGDIAVLKLPPGVSVGAVRRVAERLVEELPYVRSVWLAASPVRGERRVRERLVHLAGERRTETVYREHGCEYRVDIARVFITPRLSYEHARVARLVRPWEVVTNMFAGAGLFSVLIACWASPRRVYSIDINPDAYRYMVENARLNRVDHIVEPILGDAAGVVRGRLRGTSDRVLMPLPELAEEYMPEAVAALRARGVIHVYLHVRYSRGEDPRRIAVERALEAAARAGAPRARVIGSRRVRPVGPRMDQVVVDLLVG